MAIQICIEYLCILLLEKDIVGEVLRTYEFVNLLMLNNSVPILTNLVLLHTCSRVI